MFVFVADSFQQLLYVRVTLGDCSIPTLHVKQTAYRFVEQTVHSEAGVH